MSDNDFTNDSMLELYLFEETTLLDSLDDILLKSESERSLSKENIHEIFRIMHTIKGSSAMMSFDLIADVAHKAEDVFAIIREHDIAEEFFQELMDLVLKASDFLKAEIGKIQEGDELDTENADLISELTSFQDKITKDLPEKETPDVGRMIGGNFSRPPSKPKQPTPPENIPVPTNVISPQHENNTTEKTEPKFDLDFDEEAEAKSKINLKTNLIHESFDKDIAEERTAALNQSGTAVPGRILGQEDPREQIRNATQQADDATMVTNHASQTYILHIRFNEGSKMENVRAFMLVDKLKEFGDVMDMLPKDLESAGDAADAIMQHGFYCSFVSTLTEEEVINLTKGTLSVESVEFATTMPNHYDETSIPQHVESVESVESEARHRDTTSNSKPKAPSEPQTDSQVEAPKKNIRVTSSVQKPSTQPVKPDNNVGGNGTLKININTMAVPSDSPNQARAPRPISQASGVGIVKTVTSAGGLQTAATTPAQVSVTQIAQKQAPSTNTNQKRTSNTTSSTNKPTRQNLISVDLNKLDTLLDLVGEIVITESMVTENPDIKGLKLENFNKSARQLNKLTDELQDAVMSVRMVPVSATFQRMRRIVRDMGKSLGKDAELIMSGENTEVDKTILDALNDPLMHLVRNAMDHAIETFADRKAAGKSTSGHITLSAHNIGGDIIISVSDDGKGLDKDKILEKARNNKLLRKPDNEYTEKEIYNLLMMPGFSTKEAVTEFSGRGVGMDVVKSNIERIGGTVIIESEKGVGTNIMLKIPLTLAIISCMEVSLGKSTYSIPISNIRESFRAEASQIIIDPLGNELIMLRGIAYPIIRLHDFFGEKEARRKIEDGILILVDSGEKLACVLVDELINKFQVVVKPIPAYLKKFNVNRNAISGCTIMGNGEISLIIDVQELIS
ncbi:MAG: chemotaxis protein CheA [Clostridiales Family XIII bacterium]|jgi:chemotaxis protein histidine kinase CheA|nr:chemotaxis protein CheA [Clostridiales Family XIII bacterium]